MTSGTKPLSWNFVIEFLLVVLVGWRGHQTVCNRDSEIDRGDDIGCDGRRLTPSLNFVMLVNCVVEGEGEYCNCARHHPHNATGKPWLFSTVGRYGDFESP